MDQETEQKPTVDTKERIVEREQETNIGWFSLPDEVREEIKSSAGESIAGQVAPHQIAVQYMSAQLDKEEMAAFVRDTIHQAALLLSITLIGVIIAISGLWYGVTRGLVTISLMSILILGVVAFHLYRWKRVIFNV